MIYIHFIQLILEPSILHSENHYRLTQIPFCVFKISEWSHFRNESSIFPASRSRYQWSLSPSRDFGSVLSKWFLEPKKLTPFFINATYHNEMFSLSHRKFTVKVTIYITWKEDIIFKMSLWSVISNVHSNYHCSSSKWKFAKKKLRMLSWRNVRGHLH